MATAEADKLWREARKLTSPSFLSFRLSSDWERAGPLAEKAAGLYRQAKAWEQAREAFELAAKCAARQSSPWHEAKHLERAAEAARETADWGLALDYLRQAALAFREAGRPQSAAEALAKGARWVEEHGPDEAGALLTEAVEEVESDGKLTLAGDLYRQAIGTFVKAGKHAQAVGMLLRFAAACESTAAAASQCKCYLGAVVVWLAAGDGAQAWAVYQDALAVDTFARSEEAFAAEALLDAYRSGDAEVVRKCAARSVFSDLDNQVARLARKLPSGPVAPVAAALGGGGAAENPDAPCRVSAADLDEDDLT